jgi:uncharacterized protein (TIGR02246 family)
MSGAVKGEILIRSFAAGSGSQVACSRIFCENDPEPERRTGMSDDERAIRDLIQTWLAASQKADLESVLSLMADDVIFRVPGQNPFGKEVFAASFKGLKDFRFEASSDIKEIKLLGDWAYLRNYLEVTITPPGGGAPLRQSGHTLTILRKEPDGRWLVARDANLLAPQA